MKRCVFGSDFPKKKLPRPAPGSAVNSVFFLAQTFFSRFQAKQGTSKLSSSPCATKKALTIAAITSMAKQAALPGLSWPVIARHLETRGNGLSLLEPSVLLRAGQQCLALLQSGAADSRAWRLPTTVLSPSTCTCRPSRAA